MSNRMLCISIIVSPRNWKKFDNEHMKLRRWILLGLLIPAMGILVAGIIWPGVGLEYLGIIYVVPVISFWS